MNFNLEDPLAGILSDGSDDSFFDDDMLGKKKPIKKQSTPLADKKSTLFDLDDKTESKSKSDSRDLGVKKSETIKSTLVEDNFKPISTGSKVDILSKITTPTPARKNDTNKSKTNVFEENSDIRSPSKTKPAVGDDILHDLLGKKVTRKGSLKSFNKAKQSESLVDDILGENADESKSRKNTAPGKKTIDLDSILGKSESKITMLSKSSKSNVKTQLPKTEETKIKDAPIKKTKASDDWLGLFDDDKVETDEPGMPSWLVGDSKIKTADAEVKTKPKELEKNNEVNINQTANSQKPDTEIDNIINLKTSSNVFERNEDLTAEGAAMCMQQQESQLMVALQLKAQEERLAALQLRQEESAKVQREAARAHQSQVEALLQRQAAHRQQMQVAIASHQDRITQRIKALLGPPNEDAERVIEDYAPTREEGPLSKEKKQLLQLVQSLQENHDKEIDLMETSYRRQLAFLEVSLSQVEERMKEESDKQVKFYSEKIIWLEEHHNKYKKLTEENINNLNESHKVELESLRHQHLENIKTLQEHHSLLMENMKNAVKQEQMLIKDSEGFSSNLLEVVADVKRTKSYCQQLAEKLNEMSENSQKLSDDNVRSRERQITDMIEQLKKERENFEIEKTENRETVKLLENRLKQTTSLMEEESATLKQKRMEFEFEKATFNKQTEFAKKVLKKQDEEVKTIREEIQREYDEKISRINEEKSKAQKDSIKIAKEKTTIENLKQELETLKAELQAQLEEAAEERSKLNLEKQQIHLNEQRNIAKGRDLDLLAKNAVDKQNQADKKYAEAEFTQQKYEERIRRIQEHVASINAREKQIAKEKVALSRERLSIHNERKQIETKQCSLCKSGQNMNAYSFEASYEVPDNYLSAPVSRDYSGNMCPTINAIDTEMAHVMAKNFEQRHTQGLRHMEGASQEEKFSQVEAEYHQEGHSDPFKDILNPKLMMLKLDMQHILNNIQESRKENMEVGYPIHEEHKEQ